MRLLKTLRFCAGKDTCLRQVHEDMKAKIVQFAGYNLPVLYAKGIIGQHLHCRSAASLFDVSHMGQITIQGRDTLKLLQTATVGNTNRPAHECYLTLFLNQQAGIIDDAIAAYDSTNNASRIVVNGANKYIVMAHLQSLISKRSFSVSLRLHDENGLIALQGPKSATALNRVFPSLQVAKILFMTQFTVQWKNTTIVVTRSGYTGEDGFELGGAPAAIYDLTRELLKDPTVEMAGLGARDSLRLEAGLCLHGHDILPTITPLEAALMWTVVKSDEAREAFIGLAALRQLQEDVKKKNKSIRKRVGFVVTDAGVVREHCKIFAENSKLQVGETTSGTHAPSLKKSIGMAYVSQSKEGTTLEAEQRGRKIKISVVKMPFVPYKYYRG